MPPGRSHRAPGTVCVTVDNLGEAAELGGGTWPSDAPVGEHFTVGVVRRMLELLERHGVAATFFVEAFNAEVYPALLREIVARGHEIACHGWQHELWGTLTAGQELRVLSRSTRALRRLGVEPVGFRPPGGQVTTRTPGRLAELGYRYYSPVGSRAGVADGLAVIPFAWPLVDAFYCAPALAGLRQQHGESPTPQAPAALRAGMLEAMRASVARGASTVLVFHPSFLDGEEPLSAFEAVMAGVRALADRHAVESVTMRELAERMLGAREPLPPPVVDGSTWVSQPATGSGR